MRRTIGAVGATLTATGLILGATGLVGPGGDPQTSQANAALRYLYSQVGADGSVVAGLRPRRHRGHRHQRRRQRLRPGHAEEPVDRHDRRTTTWAPRRPPSTPPAARPSTCSPGWPRASRQRSTAPRSSPSSTPPPARAATSSPTARSTARTRVGQRLLAGARPCSPTARAGVALPAHATGWLSCAQRSDGGFGYVIHDTAATPPASCGDTASDTNSTAIILQALAKAGITSANTAARGLPAHRAARRRRLRLQRRQRQRPRQRRHGHPGPGGDRAGPDGSGLDSGRRRQPAVQHGVVRRPAQTGGYSNAGRHRA